ncbi:PadR family transcriptional regulator [Amycolatopsis nigrescens]|uniref:PadR family transcriptional regulator n=1 Tax=Amycolatopsis nigrescens TaxID=381445 RepID=UPI00036601F2|nr:PadR family transcriptional regulator [Amycolatopsis nigrescens]
MARRGRANPLALAVLTLVYERPMHPYEMSGTLRERHKEDSIKLNYGSLYSVVESLRKRGLVEAQETVREGKRPERTIYRITDAGATEMTDWLSDLMAHPAKEFTQFEAALSLMPILPPDEVIRLLEIRLRTQVLNKKKHDGLLAQAPGRFPRLFLIETEFQQALLGAEIEFIRGLLEELRSGEFPGLRAWQRQHDLRASGASPEEVVAVLTEEFKEEMSWLDQLDSEHP